MRTSALLVAVAFLSSLGHAANAQTLVDPAPLSVAAADTVIAPATELVTSPEPDVLVQETATEPALPEMDPNPPRDPADPVPQPAATEVSSMPRRYHFSLALDGSLSYDDNITLAQTDKVSGTFARLQAVLSLGVGDIEGREGNYLRLDYTPTAFFYFDHSQYDTLDHIVRLEGYHRFRRLALTVSQDIQSTSNSTAQAVTSGGTFTRGTNVDVGVRQRLTTYFTRANTSYDVTGKTSLSVGGSYSATDYGSLINSETIAGTLGLDYRYGPKLSFGLAGTVGDNTVDDPSPDQTFEQVNVRTSYELTGKISTNASAGIEFRQFEHGSSGHTAPVFDIGMTYTPFDGTAVSLNGSSQTLNSATLAGQDYSSTQITVSIKQRLLRRFSLGLTGGYQNLSYFNTVNGESTTRDDNYYFVQPALDAKITNFWFAGAYYLHRQNNSSFDAFGFNDNQFGVHSGIKF
jgi:hypothetical protein